MSNTCVVIATKNEAGNIASLLREIKHYVEADIIVVDDSDDHTAGIAKASGANVINGRRRGIADAYYVGFREAIDLHYTTIIQMDAGMTHDPAYIQRLLDNPAPVVFAKRAFVWKGFRTLLSKVAAKIVGVPDATCGFRKWSLSVLQSCLPINCEGFAFQIEMLYRAQKRLRDFDGKIEYVSVPYRLGHGTTLSPWMIVEAIGVVLCYSKISSRGYLDCQ